MYKQSLIYAAVSSFVLSFGSHQVLADSESFSLEEIIVTAQKREQSLSDVPISVQAMTGAGLVNAGVQDFADLVNVSPSLSLQDNLTPWQKSIYIRGVGTTINSPTVESSVSAVLDGVVLARQGQFFSELADIERVEVLRGPQSTLFGKNASAGVVSVVTKKPDLEQSEGSVELAYDEYGEQRIRGTYGSPLSASAAYRLSGNYKYVDENHLENVQSGGSSLDGANAYALRGKLLWQLGSDLEVLFIADYGENDSPGGVRVVRSLSDVSRATAEDYLTESIEFGEGNRQVSINDRNENYSEEWGLSAEVNWDLESHTFTSISAYRSWESDDDIDIDSGGFDIPYVSILGQGTPFFRGLVSGNKKSEQLSQEFRLQSNHDSDLQYVLGAFLWNTSYESFGSERRQVCLGGFINPVGTSCDGLEPTFLGFHPVTGTPLLDGILVAQSELQETEIDTEYYALFGQLDYAVTESLILTLGLRGQQDVFDFEKQQLGTVEAEDLPMGGYQGGGSVTNKELTGKFGFQYLLDDESNIYLSYSRGYKGPGADIGLNFEAPLEPETVNAFELGYKSRLLENRLSINTAIFSQNFVNTQVSYFDVDDSAFRPTNAGESRQRGLEVDSQFAASENLILNASVTYLDAEFTEYTTACYAGDFDPSCALFGSKDVAGEVTPYSPEWKLVAGGRYTRSVPGLNADGFVQLNYRWQSETQYDANQNPLTLQGDFGVFDLSFGLEDQAGRYRLSFYVKNITDERYVNNLAAFVDATGTAETVIQFVPKSADRYVGGNIKFYF